MSVDRDRTDCWAAFDVAAAGSGPVVRCADGDPGCDADGIADGVCSFAIRVCVHLKHIPDCIPRRVTAVTVSASSRLQPAPVSIPPPPLPANKESCGEMGVAPVALRRRTHRGTLRLRRGYRVVRLDAMTAQGLDDHDYVRFYCYPNAIPCLSNPTGGPRALQLAVAGPGSDLDLGATGAAHNFALADGWNLQLCLAACDAETNPVCYASGVDSYLGPPLPMLVAGTPVCLVSRVRALTGTADVRSGAIALAAQLATEFDLTDETHVCPRCLVTDEPGHPTCDSGPDEGLACTVDGIVTVGDSSYPVSRYCLPAGAVGSLALAVPLTTGPSALTLPCPDAGLSPVPRSCDDCTDGACTGDACATRSADGVCIDANGAASQACCASEPTRPCFRTDVVERAGTAVVPTPLWPDVTYPKTASGAVLAGTFCAAATGAAQVDGGIGLPAPGAVLVPVGETWVK